MPSTRTRSWLLSLEYFRPGLGWLFAAALIPGILIWLILSYGIYQHEREQLEKGALQAARVLLKAIDAELIKAEFTALTLSRSEHLTSKNFSAFYSQAIDVIQAVGAGNNLVLSDKTGQQILNTAQPFGVNLPIHANMTQINRILQTGRPAISDFYVDAVLKRPMFTIDVPVLQGGKPVYILSLGVMPEYFSQFLLEQKLPSGWIAALLDSRNTVIARNLNPESALGKKATPDLQAQLGLKPEGTLASHSLEGTATFLAFTRSASSNWTLAVGMTRDVLYQNLYRLLALVAFSFLTFLASVAFLAWKFSRYVRKSLEALGAATDAAALGDRNAQAPISGLHEIDRVAEQFNNMQEAHKQMEEVVRRLAYYDSLTGLANRLLLGDRLTQAMLAGKRNGRFGALLFMDLDNFKSLNDTQGHGAGDLLLIEVARRLKSLVREIDTVARFGGDEFVVLLQDLDPDNAKAKGHVALLAEKIRSLLAEPYLLSLAADATQPARGIEHRCTASIGVALFLDMSVSEEDVIKRADIAMYQAKEEGRSRVRFF